MSNIEPTEEQRRAAKYFADPLEIDPSQVARLLAEREAKLREEHVAFFHKEQEGWTDTNETLRAEAKALRARVAELEATCAENAIDSLWAQVMKKREAQHLADIKALRDFIVDAPPSRGRDEVLEKVRRPIWPLGSKCLDESDDLVTVTGVHGEFRTVSTAEGAEGFMHHSRLRLAHYDDAKAAAPAVPSFSQWRETPIARNLLKQLKTIAPASTEGEATDE